MNATLRNILMLGSLVGAALLAGCAENGGEPDQATDGVPDQALGDERTVAIDGRVYECDDTIQTTDACEEYVYEEGADPSEATLQGTANEDGTATIDGRTYACEDQSDVNLAEGETTDDGACEEYRLSSET